jgi:DNA-binding transcriptional LysR family regulator
MGICKMPRQLEIPIDLQQLLTVLAANFGSLRQAAQASLVKQSTLSRSIRQLERLIGVTIFERWSGGVRPTPAGRSFLRMSRSILEQVDALVATATPMDVAMPAALRSAFAHR